MKSQYAIMSVLFLFLFTVKCNAVMIDTTWVSDDSVSYNVLSLDTNSTEAIDCSGDTGCYVGVGFILKSEAEAGVSVDTSYFVHGSTIGEVETDMFNQIGGLPYSGLATFKVRDGHTNAEDYCVTIVHIVGNESSSNYRALGSSFCRDLPPADVTCSLFPSEINIDHGSVTTDQVDGHTATKDIKITCSQKSDVKLSFENTDGSIVLANTPEQKAFLKSDGSITSSIQINGKDINDSSVLLQGVDDTGYNVTITSILHSTGAVSAGGYSGSAVFIIAPE